MENPQAGQDAQVDENIAEALVHEVLEPVESERPATPLERVFEEIDEYVGSVERDPEVGEGSGVNEKGKEVVDDTSTESDDEKDDDDSDSDDDDSPDYTAVNENFERVGHQLVLKGSSSRKRPATKDLEYLPEEEESDGE